MTRPSSPVDPSIGSLYPFLSSTSASPDALLADLRRSTTEKIAEIVGLRAGVCRDQADRLLGCAERMAASFAAGGRLFAFGNGGSSTDAQAVAAAFMHPVAPHRPLPAFALTNDVATLSALANDVSFDVVFARQVAAFGRRRDIAVGLSTSGGSSNVLAALDEARRRDMLTVGLAGYDGGRMAASGAIDHLFVVPSTSVHRIQEAQTTLYHLLWRLTQDVLSTAAAPA